jgi:PhzF family phenazine biosynthesis protein
MKYFIVEAFTDRLYSGNPAGVCLLDKWLEPELMQRIAGENNLPETAFIVKEEEGWRIRWFTPAFEIDLCGHATLASGFVVLTQLEKEADRVYFNSQSGQLCVIREGDRFLLDFPSRAPTPVPVDPRLSECLGVPVLETHLSRDLIIVVPDEKSVKNMTPDFDKMREIKGCLGFVPTAKGDNCDFVSRYFDPNDAIIEDPVTGSAHCTLIPFWKERLGKCELHARQLSRREGDLYCRDEGERVKISGNAVLYLEGELFV